MNNFRFPFFAILILLFFSQCADTSSKESLKSINPAPKVERKRTKPANIQYTIVKKKKWSADSLSANELAILSAVNRTDKAHLVKMDSILVPADLSGDIEYYLPFPLTVSSFKDIDKIIFFSYPAQSFGAYEHGELVYAGPTNMGRKADPTPTGLYFTNWKAEKTTSTFNDEWELKWNFNIQNKEGIGWHEYEMPGYPASHSCLRLTEKDAKYLYDWADEWIIKGTDNILAQGTPVIVFGNYSFGKPKPWWQLSGDPDALNISEQTLQQLAAPYLNKILQEQMKRAKLNSKKS